MRSRYGARYGKEAYIFITSVSILRLGLLMLTVFARLLGLERRKVSERPQIPNTEAGNHSKRAVNWTVKSEGLRIAGGEIREAGGKRADRTKKQVRFVSQKCDGLVVRI
jgi:hypothetical protein